MTILLVNQLVITTEDHGTKRPRMARILKLCPYGDTRTIKFIICAPTAANENKTFSVNLLLLRVPANS